MCWRRIRCTAHRSCSHTGRTCCFDWCLCFLFPHLRLLIWELNALCFGAVVWPDPIGVCTLWWLTPRVGYFPPLFFYFFCLNLPATVSLSFLIWNQRGQRRKCLKTNLCFKQTLENQPLVLVFDMHKDTYPLSIISESRIEAEVLQESLLSP